jgi:hypothetical protein
MGWRLGLRLGRRSLGVLNPLAQTPTPQRLKPLVEAGVGVVARKAD